MFYKVFTLACQIAVFSQISGELRCWYEPAAGPRLNQMNVQQGVHISLPDRSLEPDSRVTMGFGRSQETATRSYLEPHESVHNLTLYVI